MEEKLDLKLKEALRERTFLTDKKGEIRWLNYYIGELILILEPLQRVTVGIKLEEFLKELDNTKTLLKAIAVKNKFIKELTK